MTRTRLLTPVLVLAALVLLALVAGLDTAVAVVLVVLGVALGLAAVGAVTLLPLLVVLHRADARGRSPVSWGAVQVVALLLAAALLVVLGLDVGPAVGAFLLVWGPSVVVGTTRQVPELLRSGRHA